MSPHLMQYAKINFMCHSPGLPRWHSGKESANVGDKGLIPGFRKGRGTRDQIANIHWTLEKAREFQKNVYFCFIDYAKDFDSVDQNKLENSERDGNTRPSYLPSEKSVCKSRCNS